MRLSKKPVIARPIPLVKGKCPEGTKGIGSPNGPTWQSVPKTHGYQYISDFWVTDSHVASLLGMTETGLLTRCPMVRRTVCCICRDEFIGKRFDSGGEIE